jgi:FAD:protein FMN transferase
VLDFSRGETPGAGTPITKRIVVGFFFGDGGLVSNEGKSEFPLIHRSRRLMATEFEIWLAGTDEEHLVAVADAALEEVARVERLLSRYDPAAELFRVNRQATQRELLIDAELAAVIGRCQWWWQATSGAFDVRHPRCSRQPWQADIQLDLAGRRIRLQPNVSLDLGAYGKGYAVDQAALICERFGVSSFLISGGSSSLIARGHQPGRSGWLVDLRDPFEANAPPRTHVVLHHQAMSTSAVTHPAGTASDVINPFTSEPLATPAACVVLATLAADAEAASTAFLVLGQERSREVLNNSRLPIDEMIWLSSSPAVVQGAKKQ